jgi:autotransporter translocation and assembly factor TamB
MNRLYRIARRIFLILALLAAALVAAGLIYIRTDSFGRLLQARVSKLLAGSFRGEITLGEIDTSRWAELVVRRVSIGYGGETIVRIPQIRLGYSLLPLLWRRVRIKIVAIDPVIDLRRAADGEWNLIEALTSKAPAAAGASAFSIRIARLDIRKALVDVAPRGAGGPHYRFEDADLGAAMTIASAGLKAELTELRGRIAAPGMPPADVYAAVSYSDANGPAKLRIGALRLTTQSSAVSAKGTIHNIGTMAGDVAVTIDKLAASDLAAILPGYPLRADIKGRIGLKGDARAMLTEADLAAGGARLQANLRLGLTRAAPHFEGDLSLARLDLKTLALPRKLAGLLDLKVEGSGAGADLRSLLGKTKIIVAGLRVGPADIGNLDLSCAAQQGTLRFAGNLLNGAGRLNVGGTAAVVGNSRYDVALVTQHFNAARISPSAPPTDLNSRTVIKGSGSDPRTIDASLDFRATASTLARVPVQSEIGARIKAGTIYIARANILSRGTTVTVKGSAGVVPGALTRLAYEVRTDRIAPWLKLAGTTGDGGLILDGTASGTLSGAKGPALRAQGRMDLRSIHLSKLSATSGHASYDLKGIGQDGWPQGDASVGFTAFEANGIKLRTVAAQVRIHGGRPPRLDIAMSARDENDHPDSFAATLEYQPARIAGSVDQLNLTLPDGAWHLTQSARFTRDARHVALSGFALASGVRSLTLDADVGSTGTQKVALSARALDLAVFKPLMPPEYRVAGALTAAVIVGGIPSAPSLEAKLSVNGLELNSQRLGQVNATADYRPSTAKLDATLHQDSSHQLELSGEIPVSLDWSNGFAARIGNNQKIRVVSAGIRLAPFGGVVPRSLKNATGLLRADLELTGSPFHPAIDGTAAIIGAGGEVVPIGVKVTDFDMRVAISPASVRIVELSAKAGDGTLNGSGSVSLGENFSPGAIDVTLQAHHWPAIATSTYQARIDGELHAGGTPGAPRVEGQIAVVDGTVHPNLDFLGGSSVPPLDDTIVVIRPGEKISPGEGAASSRAPQASSGQSEHNQTFRKLALDLQIRIHRNTWIIHEDARVELSGNLKIEKRAGGPISVVGEIDTVRGWLRFQGKRFTLASGQILFTGGSEIDPVLDIDAQYAVSNYTVNVIVAGTASKPAIKLRSQPQLGQADILSLILFGTTTSQLGQGQKTALLQQAQSMAIGAAGQALSQSLGLGSLGMSVNGESVGYGHYLNKDTYISFSPSLGASGSQTPSKVASIEYFLRRWLTITTATMSDGSRQIFLKVNKRY